MKEFTTSFGGTHETGGWVLQLGLKSKLRIGGSEEVGEFVAFGGGAAGHVGLAAASAAGDGAEVLDEVSGTVPGIVAVFSAKSPEVELVAIIDDEEGGLGEMNLLQAVEEFLQECCRSLGGDDDVAGDVLVGDEGVGQAGRASGLGLFEGFFGFDGLGFDFGG